MIVTSSPLASAWLKLLSIICWSTRVLADPVSTSIQNDPHFMGWYIAPTTTQPLMDPAFWSTTGDYARGCTTSPCSVALDCNSNVITYDNGNTGVCNICRTMTIFQTSPFGAPSATNIFCAENWSAFQIYRELPVPTTTSESVISTSSTAASEATEATQATTASRTANPSSVVSVPPPPSRTWIAGAVVGPVAGVGILGALMGWFLYRRKRNQRQLPQEYPSMGQDIKPQQMYNPTYELETASNTPPLYELSSHNHR